LLLEFIWVHECGFHTRLALPASTLQFVQTGAPAAAIVKAAQEWPADLIVIASHGLLRSSLGDAAVLERCGRSILFVFS